jgi:squalene synthase HpnC
VSLGVAAPAPAGIDPDRLAAAYAHCARIARGHYENFTIGSWLLPRRLRLDLAAVYAFARGADDLADEGNVPADERVARLDAWEERLLACARDPGAADEPLFVALGHTIARHQLPLAPLRDLLVAFRRDAAGDTAAFPTFADLLEYCRCSANPVGRIVLSLFGHRDAARQARSDDICTALQLTNFWQDVAGDLARGRTYIPAEDMDRFPGSRAALAARAANDDFRRLLAFEVARTRVLFARGLVLAKMVTGRLAREVRMFARGGMAVLDRIEAVDHDVFARRPTLTRADLARLVLGGLLG